MTRFPPDPLHHLEAASVADLHELATPAEREALGLRKHALADGFASACRADGGIMLNRSLGLSSADAPKLPALARFYREAGVGRAFLSVPEQDLSALEGPLLALGCAPARSWRQFRREAAPPPPYDGDLRVERIGPDHGEAFARIAASAFDLGPALVPVLARLPQRPHANVFLSFDGRGAIGCGVLYAIDGAGYLTWGATDPAQRGRGSQRALMAARIRHACELGLAVLHTETGEAVPGDPQHSWNNILRAGFRPTGRVFNFSFPAQAGQQSPRTGC
jgi:ribosomal protein S18 acetylase RimI-like enzyme